MGIKVDKTKWILYRNFKDYELLKEIAIYVKEKCGNLGSETSRYEMRDWLASMDLYHTRHPKVRPLDSQHHKIRTLEYYMFGYDSGVYGSRKFMFSPLGNLFIHHINDEEKLSKIFATMMFAMQFHHPCNKVDPSIQLYPMRLLFKLMMDNRIGCRIYFAEYAQFIACIKTITPDTYEQLIKNILQFRLLSNEEQLALLKEDEHYSVNCIYELQTYTSRLLRDAGVLSIVKGKTFGKLTHPKQPWAKSETPPTSRGVTDGYITIAPNLVDFIGKMLNQYSCFEQPIRFDNPEMLTIELVKQVYSFYPELLSEELQEHDEVERQLLELPNLIERYSNNPDNSTAYLFEEVLEKGFNMFYDVEAHRIGGSGHTDVECKYITLKKKFVVEAKSTANKLTLINTQRLKEHRDEVGGEYTIVITPRYVPAAKRDIRNTPVVLVTAHTFSEYLYNHIFHDAREMMYSDFDNIIINHLGEDVSQLISDLTIEKFAANSASA
jgi:hypothetical protein